MRKKTNKYKITYRIESIDNPKEHSSGETIRNKLSMNEIALFHNLISEGNGFELRLYPKKKTK